MNEGREEERKEGRQERKDRRMKGRKKGRKEGRKEERKEGNRSVLDVFWVFVTAHKGHQFKEEGCEGKGEAER